MPEDFVVATGKQSSVRDFVVRAGKLLGMEIDWRGSGVDEVGVDSCHRTQDGARGSALLQAHRSGLAAGRRDQGAEKLGWSAEFSFEELVEEMVGSDLELAKRDALVAKEGFKVYSHHE